MWHTFAPRFEGADEIAAPLFIQGIKLQSEWNGIPLTSILPGKLDTAACMTAIPLSVALDLRLPSAGVQEDCRSFDQSLPPRSYPKFHVAITIPKWATQTIIMPVIACPRDDILLGRDICKKMLLVVNWRRRAFGLTPASHFHLPLRLFFGWRKNK